jgi:protein-S-isoprenylcysteine O-methyltransferase Ste14
MTPRRINPPHYFLGSVLLMVALAQVAWGSHLLPPPWQWLGCVPIVVGVLIAVLASRQFAQVGTNIIPLTKSTALVTNGMFARTRNPMYLGMVLTLAGLAWLLNSALPWLVLVVFIAILKLRFIRHEEALMAQTFGDQYLQYKQQVRRWM